MAGLFTLPLSALSLGATPWQPAPFTAHYEVRYGALPFALNGMQSLTHTADGWRFRSELSAVVAGIEQESELMAAEDGSLQTRAYTYRLRGLAGRRERILAFDRVAGKVLRSGDKQRELPLRESAWDPLGWQLALRRDLSAAGPLAAGDQFPYQVTDGGEYKLYLFEVVDFAPLAVPAGTFDSVLLERRFSGAETRTTRVWLAPDLDYLMIRLELADDDGAVLHLALATLPASESEASKP